MDDNENREDSGFLSSLDEQTDNDALNKNNRDVDVKQCNDTDETSSTKDGARDDILDGCISNTEASSDDDNQCNDHQKPPDSKKIKQPGCKDQNGSDNNSKKIDTNQSESNKNKEHDVEIINKLNCTEVGVDDDGERIIQNSSILEESDDTENPDCETDRNTKESTIIFEQSECCNTEQIDSDNNEKSNDYPNQMHSEITYDEACCNVEVTDEDQSKCTTEEQDEIGLMIDDSGFSTDGNTDTNKINGDREKSVSAEIVGDDENDVLPLDANEDCQLKNKIVKNFNDLEKEFKAKENHDYREYDCYDQDSDKDAKEKKEDEQIDKTSKKKSTKYEINYDEADETIDNGIGKERQLTLETVVAESDNKEIVSGVKTNEHDCNIVKTDCESLSEIVTENNDSKIDTDVKKDESSCNKEKTDCDLEEDNSGSKNNNLVIWKELQSNEDETGLDECCLEKNQENVDDDVDKLKLQLNRVASEKEALEKKISHVKIQLDRLSRDFEVSVTKLIGVKQVLVDIVTTTGYKTLPSCNNDEDELKMVGGMATVVSSGRVSCKTERMGNKEDFIATTSYSKQIVDKKDANELKKELTKSSEALSEIVENNNVLEIKRKEDAKIEDEKVENKGMMKRLKGRLQDVLRKRNKGGESSKQGTTEQKKKKRRIIKSIEEPIIRKKRENEIIQKKQKMKNDDQIVANETNVPEISTKAGKFDITCAARKESIAGLVVNCTKITTCLQNSTHDEELKELNKTIKENENKINDDIVTSFHSDDKVKSKQSSEEERDSSAELLLPLTDFDDEDTEAFNAKKTTKKLDNEENEVDVETKSDVFTHTITRESNDQSNHVIEMNCSSIKSKVEPEYSLIDEISRALIEKSFGQDVITFTKPEKITLAFVEELMSENNESFDEAFEFEFPDDDLCHTETNNESELNLYSRKMNTTVDTTSTDDFEDYVQKAYAELELDGVPSFERTDQNVMADGRNDNADDCDEKELEASQVISDEGQPTEPTIKDGNLLQDKVSTDNDRTESASEEGIALLKDVYNSADLSVDVAESADVADLNIINAEDVDSSSQNEDETVLEPNESKSKVNQNTTDDLEYGEITPGKLPKTGRISPGELGLENVKLSYDITNEDECNENVLIQDVSEDKNSEVKETDKQTGKHNVASKNCEHIYALIEVVNENAFENDVVSMKDDDAVSIHEELEKVMSNKILYENKLTAIKDELDEASFEIHNGSCMEKKDKREEIKKEEDKERLDEIKRLKLEQEIIENKLKHRNEVLEKYGDENRNLKKELDKTKHFLTDVIMKKQDNELELRKLKQRLKKVVFICKSFENEFEEVELDFQSIPEEEEDTFELLEEENEFLDNFLSEDSRSTIPPKTQKEYRILKKRILEIVDLMIEDLDKLNKNLPPGNRFFGRRKDSMRKEIMGRLQSRLKNKLKSYVN